MKTTDGDIVKSWNEVGCFFVTQYRIIPVQALVCKSMADRGMLMLKMGSCAFLFI